MPVETTIDTWIGFLFLGLTGALGALIVHWIDVKTDQYEKRNSDKP